MARLKRYHFPGLFYHVMIRGVGGQNIFFSDWDRYKMLLLMQDGTERFGHQIHAFCFMNNHIHLLVQVGEISLSKIMQNLGARYAQFINARYDRAGHVFQGRFKAILIEASLYFIKLLRYIHHNPVRANLIKDPGEYVWSSHNAYVNQKKIGWLTTDFGLSQFGKNRNEALKNYSVFVSTRESLEELTELRGDFKDGQFLGSKEFVDLIKKSDATQIKTKLPLEVILKAVCDTLELELEYVISQSQSEKASFTRGLFSLIASRINNDVIEEIALLINRNGSTVSSLISRFCKKHSRSKVVEDLITKIKEKALNLADLQV